jgi:hypothetical protein
MAVVTPAIHRARVRTDRVVKDHGTGVASARAQTPEVQATRNRAGRRIACHRAITQLTGAVITPTVRDTRRRRRTILTRWGREGPEQATSVLTARAHRIEVQAACNSDGRRAVHRGSVAELA